MNAIFSAVFLIAAAVFLFLDPEAFLPALLHGSEKAATLSLALLASYCVWLGFFRVLQESGLSDALARKLSRPLGKLFRSDDRTALALAGQNMAANFLGLPGAPTPLGVKATQKFLAAKNGYAADMLFVLNATSLQLLPTTVIALRAAAGSASPADIFLPTLLATLASSLLGAALVACTRKRPKAAPRARRSR